MTSYQSQYNTQPTQQPGVNKSTGLLLWGGTIPYWFIANGRRFIVVAKVNTTFHTAYCGFILPYGSPSQYNYPLCIGGSCESTVLRWSDTQARTRNFFDPGATANDVLDNGTCKLRLPDGSWFGFSNWYQPSSEAQCVGNRNIWPYYESTETTSLFDRVRDNIDGSYTLFPVIMFSRANQPSKNIYGEFDGVYAVSGFNSGAENTVTIGGVPHLVVPNVYRTAKYQYAAIRLE